VDYLRRNQEAYDELVEFVLALRGRVRPNLLLELVGQAAWFATVNHPGYFADARLENLALAVAQSDRTPLRSPPERLPRTPGRRRVLHVATEVAAIGGHTRTIRHWAEADRESVHSLALTKQKYCEVPDWLRQAVVASGGRVVVLPPDAPVLTRAAQLRAVAADADLVVSHHFTEDVVPVAAFAAAGGPPVGVINQSDHVFWLGPSVADTVINLRPIGQTVTERRRAARHNTLLPIPVEELPPALDRTTARRQLGIRPDRVVLLSVGRANKYVPSATHNFFASVAAVLAEHQNAEMFLVGVSRDQAAAYLDPTTADRFHCVGAVENPAVYRAAADLYLEGFPFGSQTAMLEAAQAGLPPVPAFAPNSQLVVTQDEAFDGVVAAAEDEQTYRAAVGELIRSADRRRALGEECARRVRALHVGDGWLARLHQLYQVTAQLTHAPAPIPPTAFRAEPDDVGVAAFHAFHTDAGGTPAADLRYKLRQAAFDAAFAGREAGDYVGAWRVLRLARRTWGDDGTLRRVERKLLPHWLLRRIVPRRTREAVVVK
jgi:glycosyltransferase involved in cell wall biosynthesis